MEGRKRARVAERVTSHRVRRMSCVYLHSFFDLNFSPIWPLCVCVKRHSYFRRSPLLLLLGLAIHCAFTSCILYILLNFGWLLRMTERNCGVIIAISSSSSFVSWSKRVVHVHLITIESNVRSSANAFRSRYYDTHSRHWMFSSMVSIRCCTIHSLHDQWGACKTPIFHTIRNEAERKS